MVNEQAYRDYIALNKTEYARYLIDHHRAAALLFITEDPEFVDYIVNEFEGTDHLWQDYYQDAGENEVEHNANKYGCGRPFGRRAS
ncbi:hypothetical protein ACFL54_09935 [Planctomycetota bacterium]